MTTHLEKVLSGGQTGVDQAALRAASEAGLEIGGWCPPGRRCEGGEIPERWPLVETPEERSELAPSVPRSQRTEWNVRDADATLVLRPHGLHTIDFGTTWTLHAVVHYGRPSMLVDPRNVRHSVSIEHWLASSEVRVLHVAGPSEGTAPGIGATAYALLRQVFGAGPSS